MFIKFATLVPETVARPQENAEKNQAIGKCSKNQAKWEVYRSRYLEGKKAFGVITPSP